MVTLLLPTPPEYHLVENAGHFSFLAPCGWGLQATITALHFLDVVEDVCTEPEEFDRVAFKRSFNASVLRFFQQAL